MNRYIILLIFGMGLCPGVFGKNPLKSIAFDVVKKEIELDGILKKDEWASINSITGLSAPWSSLNHDQTVFKAFISETYFNFCFEVLDSTITTYDFKEELTVAKEDRVELFFSASSDLNAYYCIEMDPKGHILDYSARHYRIFNEEWNFKTARVSSRLFKGGYTVEGRIRISELEELGIIDKFHLGIFRADYRSEKADDVVWYSWIAPKSKTPDFHIPSALGIGMMKTH